MLTLDHIAQFKLDRYRLEHHLRMPAPGYLRQPKLCWLSAISDTVVASLFGVEPSAFEAQLAAAREFGVAYLLEHQRSIVGVSAVTSVVRDPWVLSKNVIIPKGMDRPHRDLANHYIVGVFIKGDVDDTGLKNVQDVILAGWVDSPGIAQYKATSMPRSFNSKLPVVMVPCRALQPIQELLAKLRGKE